MRLECGVGFRQLRTCRRTRPGQLCAMSGRKQVQQYWCRRANLFDHLVGAGEKVGWHGEANCLGGFEIDYKLEFGRQLHW
jgi:hypothetical protein